MNVLEIKRVFPVGRLAPFVECRSVSSIQLSLCAGAESCDEVRNSSKDSNQHKRKEGDDGSGLHLISGLSTA